MKTNKAKVIAILAFGAGAAAYTAVPIKNEEIKQQEARYQQMVLLAMQADGSSPIQQVDSLGPGNLVPLEQLPADATPTPGYVGQPGSVPKKIIYKPTAPAASVRPVFSIIVERTDDKLNQTGDPVWKVALVDNSGKELDALKALSGRASKQKANRHQGGNKSPLPGGIYAIDTHGIERGPFDDPELGSGYWIPVTPLFATGRSALGFHQDPSWGKMNGESGTSGCVGLENLDATVKLVHWIKQYHVKKVLVIS